MFLCSKIVHAFVQLINTVIIRSFVCFFTTIAIAFIVNFFIDIICTNIRDIKLIKCANFKTRSGHNTKDASDILLLAEEALRNPLKCPIVYIFS